MTRHIELDYPNRDKPASRVLRLLVIAVLLVSAALMGVVTVRGWDLMEGSRAFNAVFIALDLVFVVQVVRWSRGALPIAAGLAAFVAIFSGVSIGSWYARDGGGYRDAALSADLGLLTTFVLAIQLVVIAVTIAAFSQNWQEEVERAVDGRPGDAVAAGGIVAA